jgi:hypothetical protein
MTLALEASLFLASWARDASVAGALIVLAMWLPMLLTGPKRGRSTQGVGDRSHE